MATIRQQKNTRWQAIIRRRGFKMLTKTFSTQEHALMWARYIESENVNSKLQRCSCSISKV